MSQGDYLRAARLRCPARLVSGARSATPSSAVPSPRSAHASRARSTTVSRSICSPFSTHASMLEARMPTPKETIPRLKEAALARPAGGALRDLALSSASGAGAVRCRLPPLIDVLTAEASSRSTSRSTASIHARRPDQQIELFKIVQESLANVRKHAGARARRHRSAPRRSPRFVLVDGDDGAGFELEKTDERVSARGCGTCATVRPRSAAPSRCARPGGGHRARDRPARLARFATPSAD